MDIEPHNIMVLMPQHTLNQYTQWNSLMWYFVTICFLSLCILCIAQSMSFKHIKIPASVQCQNIFFFVDVEHGDLPITVSMTTLEELHYKTQFSSTLTWCLNTHFVPNFPKTKGFRMKISMQLVYQYMTMFFIFFIFFHLFQVIFIRYKSYRLLCKVADTSA